MEDKGPMLLWVFWVFTSLSILFTAARLFVRASVHRKFFLDDYLIILSMICVIISSILATMSVKWGNGKHFVELSLEQKEHVIKYMMASYVPGIQTLGIPKLAVIALLTKLLAPSRLHFWILWSMGGLVSLSLTAMVLALILQCTPTHALWTLTLPHNCLNPSILEGLAFYASVVSALLDLYLAIYPAIVLWGLQMPVKKKLALCLALGVGLICAAVATVKATGVPALSSEDVSWDLSEPLYWTSIEGNLIIIAACIPILQPLLEIFKGRPIWKSSSNKYSSKSRPYANFSKESTGDPNAIEMRSKPRKKVDVHGFTIAEKHGSEESIVNPQSTSMSSGRRSGNFYPTDGGIMRTNDVTVTYEQGGEPTSTSRWAAV